MVKLVILDLMDTIIPDPFHSAIQSTDLSMKELFKVKNQDAYIKFELGEYTEEEYLGNWFISGINASDLGFDIASFKEKLFETPKPFAHVIEFQKKLPERVKLVLGSNYGPWVHHHLQKINIHSWFDKLFVSYQMGIRKPDPAFFQIILEEMKQNPADTVFIDDRQSNLEAAAKLGMQTFDATKEWVKQVYDLIH